MSFLALSLSRKISYAKNFVLLPPEIPGGRYNLLLIAVNQIFYHRFIGLLLKEGANKQVISSQADSLIKISRIWA
ncbi:hypothetical protein OSK18_23870, partial [Escherichia coli]|nr:hypothetical protein [Escherichia coli]